jgi:GTP:adenosylcobinamide-phosphate guanylyltransferase
MDMERSGRFDPVGITAIILAGSRPGTDPVAKAAGVPSKALVPVAGEPMLSRVAHTLRAHPAVGTILVLAQHGKQLALHPGCQWMLQDSCIRFAESSTGISQSIIAAINSGGAPFPLLVTTADNALLNGEMVSSFLEGAAGSDLAVAMVERRVLLSRYPQSRRTWLKFRGGWWSGANLFWLASGKVRPLLDLWSKVEQDRKKGVRIVGAFGPLLLLGALLRLLDIHQAAAMAGKRFGVAARIVPMPQPEACIDVDKPQDKELVEAILAGRS